jgi:HlyD family secretion protein
MSDAPNATPAPPPSAAGRPARRSSRPRRWLPYALGLALVAGLALSFIPSPAPVETATVRTDVLRATVNEEGRTRIRHRFVVSAPVGGQLRRIEHRAGAEVVSGLTLIAVIDPIAPALLDARSRSLAEARRDTARANLDKAREALRFASGDLRRFEKLHREGTISPQELESFQWRETAAAKEYAAAESALRQAEAELDDPGAAGFATNRPPVTVTAPASGRVLRVFEENARVVPAGTPLLEIGDPTDLEVVIEVLSRDGAAIAPGAKVELDQWGGPQLLAASVRLIEPAAFTKVSALGVEEQRVRVIADLLTPADQRRGLGDGFRVEARIVVWEAERALQAPVGALFRRGQDWAAYVVADGRAVLRRVVAGRSSATMTQIVEGLSEGDQVILYPGDRVTAGRRIQPMDLKP